MKKKTLIVIVLVLIAVLLWWGGRPDPHQSSSPSAPPADAPHMGGGQGPRTSVFVTTPTPTDLGAFSLAQARVYAALGEVIDGRREQLPHFDGESRSLIEPLRQQLAAQVLHRGAGIPTVGAPGAVKKTALGTTPPSAQATTEEGSPSTGITDKPTTATGVHDLTLGATSGTVLSVGNEHVISGHAAWAAIKAKPGLGLPVRIVDRGEGGHVIAVFADDFGTVRVNGGLVVPGRYYLIKGSADVSAMAPVGIHIRPLSAVPSYHDQPLMVPSANG